jgi:hypothetical protein
MFDIVFPIRLSSLKISAFFGASVSPGGLPGFGLELTGATGVFDPIRHFNQPTRKEPEVHGHRNAL